MGTRVSLLVGIILTFASGNAVCGTYSGGNGSVGSPYQVATKDDLLELSATTADYNGCFILTADIDLAGETFAAALIGNGLGFSGVFDGNNHKIINLTITGSGGDYIGLFGYLGWNGLIKNLGVDNADIQGGSYGSCIGGLAGYSSGTIISIA